MPYKKIILTIGVLIFLIVTHWIIGEIIRPYNCPPRCSGRDFICIECQGVIKIKKSSKDKLLYSSSKANILAIISDIKHYKFIDNSFYAIGNPSFRIFNELLKNSTYKFSFTETSKTYEISDLKDMPHYVVINTNTGDGKLYNTLEEMTEPDRLVFQEILRKKSWGEILRSLVFLDK